LINAGRVSINGKPTRPGNRVFEKDIVRIDGEIIEQHSKRIIIAFNKPVGIVCTTDRKESRNIIDCIDHPERLFPVGRLDMPSQGLILLTNDGDIVNKILRAGNNHEKEYIVSVDKPITPAFLKKMSQGIQILGTRTKKCHVEKVNDYTFNIILTQGLNRQIRRMCEALGYAVKTLRRIRIMKVTLGNLKSGHWRNLTRSEVQQINKMVAGSSKTEEASRDKRKNRKPSRRKSSFSRKSNKRKH
jgi:23S rRNA pseudouridine2604 synthase